MAIQTLGVRRIYDKVGKKKEKQMLPTSNLSNVSTATGILLCPWRFPCSSRVVVCFAKLQNG